MSCMRLENGKSRPMCEQAEQTQSKSVDRQRLTVILSLQTVRSNVSCCSCIVFLYCVAVVVVLLLLVPVEVVVVFVLHAAR